MENKRKIEKLSEELREGGMPSMQARIAAEIAINKGYRKERVGMWIVDKSYDSKTRVKYFCSECGGYHVVKRWDRPSDFWMKYCPVCGARCGNVEEAKEDNG